MAHIENLDIVYEDNHILVVIKPCNILSQGDNTHDISIVDIAKKYLKEKYNKSGNVYLGLIHRLDRPVSGLMVLAKTSKAATRLSNELQKKNIARSYFAIVEGQMEDTSLLNYLKQDENGFVRCTNEGEGQKALLHAHKIISKNTTTLMYIELDTGRKHQIRVQLSNSGHPILYDMRYGNGETNKQIALFGGVLRLSHPTTKEIITFLTLPKDEAFIPYKKDIEEFLRGRFHEGRIITKYI